MALDSETASEVVDEEATRLRSHRSWLVRWLLSELAKEVNRRLGAESELKT